MSSYFGRNYLLTITPVSGDELTYQPPLEIRFAVDNTPQNVDATARITLYGISARTRALIQRYDDKEKRYGNLILKAGYGDNIGTIFSGRIHNVEVVKEGVNTCLRLYCRTIGLAWNTTIFKTWGANTPAIEMLKDVAAVFGLDVEVIGDFSDLPRFATSYNSGGRLCRDILDSVKDDWKYYWMITPSRVLLAREGAARKWATHEITAKNGMESVPRWYLSTMEIDVKMNHQIQPADVINVTSSFWTINFSGMYNTDLNNLANIQQQTGQFNVLRTYHEGTLWGDTWKTTLISQWRMP
ncbi:TPA: hypothetical protein PXN31_003280 [Yersinia enterocolitica]|uniref:hypothetical protein n=1 Tax=Yersinia enterocolitica TaxID=630 RepID=UPI002857277E|nr:hypothetical protein [Yersinia enterocolitica]HDL7377436.1 hypothetical protein [Yersinia enterocolitica]HDL7385608.1 hypothetical protein [Yersinia enterocolitica]HDL7402711.1 hypothetical protein [Yersinia enterocolitica]HDM8087920.1 hypothetical protein [Yersinia enterocolitica]